jgi:hypothetical protein
VEEAPYVPNSVEVNVEHQKAREDSLDTSHTSVVAKGNQYRMCVWKNKETPEGF